MRITSVRRFAGDRGFSLLEVLVATSIVAVGVSAIAQLAFLALYANGQARQTTIAPVLAQQKIEELFADAAAGGLTQSPAGTLESDVNGFCDFLDRTGQTLGAGPASPAGAAYVRRWSIEPLPASPHHTSILQVLVRDLRRAGVVSGVRLPGDARIVAATPGKAF